MKITKHDPQRLFEALSTDEMLEEMMRREMYRHQQDKASVPPWFAFSVGILIGILIGMVFHFALFVGARALH